MKNNQLVVRALVNLMVLFPMFVLSVAANAGVPSKMPIEGRLTNPDGTPMTYASAQIRVEIYSPGSENCLLYGEVFAVDLSASSGRFAVALNGGSGTVETSYGWTFADVFKNTGTFATGSPACTTGSGYTPSASDSRNVKISVNDGGGWDPFPAYAMHSNPFALQAGNADTLGGVASTNFVQTNTVTGFNLSQANMNSLFADASYNELVSLIAGTSTKYAGVTAGNLALGAQKSFQMGHFTSTEQSAFTGGLTAGDKGKMWFNTTTNTMMVWDGTAAVTVGSGGGGGTVTNVSSGNAYLSVATGATTPVLTVNVGMTANTVAAGDDPRIANALQASVTSPVSGQYVRYNGSQWVNQALFPGDVMSALGFTPVDKAGDTMTGLLTLSGDPSMNLHSATKQYVDSAISSSSAALLRLDGSTPMAGSLRSVAGNPTLPGYTFSTDTNTGMYLASPDQIGFVTNGTPRMMISSVGEVATNGPLSVGTLVSPPGGPLYVYSNMAGNPYYGDAVIQNDSVTTTGPSLQLYKTRSFAAAQSGDSAGKIYFTAMDTSSMQKHVAMISATATNVTPAAGTLSFSTMSAGTSNVRMTIDPIGNVGIGTTIPSANLAFNGASPQTIAMDRSTMGGAAGNNLTLMSGGTMMGNSNQNGGNLILSSGVATGTGSSQIEFKTSMSGSSGSADNGPSTKMVVMGNGKVGIGTTTPAYLLELSSDSAAKPGTSSWTIASDLRLKDIRAPFTRGLAALDGINTVYFRYKEGNALNLPADKEFVGIRAQDVQRSIPEAVSVDDKGYLHVTNDAVNWTVFNAVKELYGRWMSDSDELHREVQELKSRNAELEARLHSLEERMAR